MATSSDADESDAIIDTPVVIVGGGPSGLLLSNLLSRYQTPSVLLEAQTTEDRFRHPQAHFINTRSMEILKQHLPTMAYQRILDNMPPVDHWKYFQFGYSCREGIMARVQHPVDRPLESNRDANAALLPLQSTASSSTESLAGQTVNEDNGVNVPLSQCSVGHLAQHTFSRILYESALEQALQKSASKDNGYVSSTQVRFGEPVISVERLSDIQHDTSYRHQYLVQTQHGTTFRTPVVVAADGANSFLRKQWNLDWDEARKDTSTTLELINVYFTTSQKVASQLPHAMLYSIFHPKLVGMMVCHSLGEYVLQIPYFPPYQTVEGDFRHEEVMDIVKAALGFENQEVDSEDIQILSIKPWTMSSSVARHYHDGHGGVLVGDAAHVFPPAGGFGMNTGMQDSHNLAWRLALWYKRQYVQDDGPIIDENENAAFRKEALLEETLATYSLERRPVAEQNTALSERNYERILRLTNGCYLNDQHPKLLMQVLEASSSLMVPLAVQRTIFANLLKTAMMPLSSLREGSANNFHARHITSNVRTILERGGGLPLLFPRWELNFGYSDNDTADEQVSWKQDSLGFEPQIRVGHLLPYVELEVLSDTEGRFQEGSLVASNELPSILRQSGPYFVVLILVGGEIDIIDGYSPGFWNSLESFAPMVELVEVRTGIKRSSDTLGHTSKNKAGRLILNDSTGTPGLSQLFDQSVSDTDPSWTLEARCLLVRPDGHIVIACRSEEEILEGLGQWI